MDEVAQVRSFNRTLTQRIGALQDQYLASGRSLGASRVLWEIGDGDADVRSLRERLGLDSGYLSRLLRSLESERLVVVAPAPGDKRVRTVRLTDRGRAERGRLERATPSPPRSSRPWARLSARGWSRPWPPSNGC
jgi:DNA-binding MarR family transcriptional regulator